MVERAIQYLRGLPNDAGHVVCQTFGSVTAGVGNILDGRLPGYENERPQVEEFGTPQAFEAYKEYNTRTNLRASRIRFYAGLVRQVAGLFLGAAGTAVGVIVGMSISSGALTIPSLAFPIIGTMLGVATALTVGSFLVEQFAIRDQSNKHMEVGDFQNARLAHMVGHELSRQQEQAQGRSQPVSHEVVTIGAQASPSRELQQPQPGTTLQPGEREWQRYLSEQAAQDLPRA